MLARKQGIDLADVPGSGPKGRISKEDLERYIANPPDGQAEARTAPGRRSGAEEVKVIGVRRVIAQRLSEAKRTIPHFSYVEEVDVTDLEALRLDLNRRHEKAGVSLTYLPFVCIALIRALDQFPQCNATYDAERNVILRHRPVHIGIATQTPDGLKVPVVQHAEARDLWDLAREIQRVSGAARNGSAPREMLTGSTITVTSLGRLGGIASTPVINMPEVAIIGVNKSVERPAVRNGAIVVRRLMNLSSSFDHRFVDGYDAAGLIQAVRERLEQPALLFVSAP
jgi:2-oxoisovalerate dehydrogenase E2 component (dihydrolipoyl transacylase)